MVAENITVTRHGDTAEVTIDGVAIPANAIKRDSVYIPVDPDELPSVCLELIATEVTSTNTLNPESESETP